jgi:hypothetical protein
MSVQKFLSDLNIAQESEYFQINPRLRTLRFNAVFENEIELLMDSALADNLIGRQRNCVKKRGRNRWECITTNAGVYETIPNDKKDMVTFVLDYIDFDSLSEIGSLNLYLRPTHVQINRQLFKVRQFKIM